MPLSCCLTLRVVTAEAWGPLFNKTSRPRTPTCFTLRRRARDDDETVESLWSDWDIPRRMMQAWPLNVLKSCLQVALWIKEKNEETGEQPSQSMF